MASPVPETTAAAKVAQATAICGGIGCALLPFLNENADAIIALTAVGGFGIALVTGLFGMYLQWKRHKWDGRERRTNRSA